MASYTSDSLSITAGTHGDYDRFPVIVDHIYDADPDIIAIEYNPDRLISYLEEGFKNGSREYPTGDIYLAIHAAADTNTPLALIDTAEEIPQNADELYSQTTIDNAINDHRSMYASRPSPVSRQAIAEIRNRHPEAYVKVMAKRDRRMAGHLRYLTQNNLNVFGVMGGNHLPGIVDRLRGIVDIEPQLVTAPPIRTNLPPLTASEATWVRRWLPNTTHPAKVNKSREESASHN